MSIGSDNAKPSDDSQSGDLVGYIHEVSPTKVSAKGSTYFSFYIQDKERVSKAICFSPEKHKLVQSKAESCTPCKLTKYNKNSNKDTDDNVVWVNKNTRIDDAPDTLVDFPYEKIEVEVPTLTSVQDLRDVKVNQLVTLQGKVIFGTNTPEKVGSKGYTKLDGFFIDQSGTVPLTIWNETIQLLEEGTYYEAQNVRLRQYNSEKYITSTPTSVFKQLSGSQPAISEEIVKAATTKATMSQPQEVLCHDIQSVEIIQYYSCVTCAKRVQSRPDSLMAKCDNCRMRFLLEKSKKIITARISTKTAQEQLEWYSLFPSALEDIINNYNNTNSCQKKLETLDEEKLSEIILLAAGMKLVVNNSNNTVNNIKFV